jgi:hypothetical protein
MSVTDIGIAFILTFLIIYIVCIVFRNLRRKESKGSIIPQSESTPDKDKIIKTLFESVIHQKSRVQWPLLMACSIVYSIIVVRLFSWVSDNTTKFIILIPITFLLLYGIFISLQAHGGNQDLEEASDVYNAYKKKLR